jgi:cell pole-organizing protein PopZ
MSAKEQDQSMEEILQSIKRIIAEEGEPAPSAGSDILELTDMLTQPAETQETVEAAVESMSIDEIMAMPATPAPAPEPEAVPETPAPTIGFSNEGLVSNAAVETAAASIKTLLETPGAAEYVYQPLPSAQFRSGATVEDLVVEALRPMLKEWLDGNLPQMVERLVDREIKRIVALTKNV